MMSQVSVKQTPRDARRGVCLKAIFANLISLIKLHEYQR